MPVLPKDNIEGIRTRSQRQQEMDQRRFEDTASDTPGGPEPTEEPVPGPSRVSSVPMTLDLSALMAMMQEQARRQEEQARRLEEQLQRDKEEQARRQEEQARRQEEQARRLEEQLQRDKEEQARRQDEQMLLMKDIHATFVKELKAMKEQVYEHENRISNAEAQIADMKKALGDLKVGNTSATVGTIEVAAPSVRGFKVPPFDGTSSWSAYKIQFEAVMKANGWSKAQAMTALTLGLRDQALTILEALGKDMTYEQLLEALEARYGDAHLEHVFRAQLKERVQRSGENLQQWALEVEKLVRKAYQSAPALIDGILVQTFIDGIRDLEVRAAVRLGHHETLKDALAHALEVEAVRQDHRAHRIREVVASPVHDRRQGYGPRCYTCGERGHLRSSCPKRRTGREDRLQQQTVANTTAPENRRGTSKRQDCGAGAGWCSKSPKDFDLTSP